MKKFQILQLSTLFLFMVACSGFQKEPTTTSQWRGPNRDAVYPEKGLLKEWPKSGPELAWSFDKLGIGYTSSAVTSEKVYITGIIDSIGNLFAFDHSGNLLWQKEYGLEWTVNFPGTRTTPLIHNEHGYLLSGYGNLICFHTGNGNMLWSKNILEDYNGVNPEQGITENLIIDGNAIFCAPGGPEANVVALNRMTGEEIWVSKGSGEKSAFCSPQLIKHEGKKFYITMTDSTVLSIDIENGNVAWKLSELKYRYPDHPNTPIYKDGYLFYVDGGNGGSAMLKITDGGYGVEKVWKSETIDNVIGNAVSLNGKLYSASGSQKKWACVDWKTGEDVYFSDVMPGGSVIAADEQLYCYAFSGEFGLMKPTETGFELQGSFKVPGEKRDHWAHPVIFDGKLYVRYHDNLWVYNI